jgi:hypothetical protein
MFKNKILPMFLAGSLCIAGLPVTSFAAVTASSTGEITTSKEMSVTAEPYQGTTPYPEPTKEALESIIKSVKTRITIPKELTEFEYSYSAESSYDSAAWNLNWFRKGYKKQISIQTDQFGNILSYNEYGNGNRNSKPEYLKKELVSAAKDFIKKVAPDIYNNIEYVGAESQGIYSAMYMYQFRRVENKIPMPDNTISVGINFSTGKVELYRANWLYNIKIPSPEATISKTEAAKIIGKEVKMTLSYQNAYITDTAGKTKTKAFLVYSPDKSYIAVNAATGEVYTTQNEWITKNEYVMDSSKAAATADGNDGGLTEQEITEADSIKGIISREEAIKSVTDNKSLLLDKNLKNINATIYKQYDYTGDSKKSRYVWNITMSDPREVDYNSGNLYRAYANAVVDAQNGQLVSFNSNVKDLNSMNKKELESIKIKYSKSQCQSIMEEFLKKQIPDKFKNSVLSEDNGDYIIAYKDDKEVYGGYNFNYDRVNQGINYSYNRIYGSVDGVTGKIYNYNYSWDDNIVFESPYNLISAAQAFESYISKDGFNLVYEINNKHYYKQTINSVNTSDAYSKEYEVRLVYRTDITPQYISPFTGKQLGYDGEAYIKDKNSYSYSDIKGIESARNIMLLADNGIGFKGGQFLPDKPITGNELFELLTSTNINYDADKYQEKKNDSSFTRMEAARLAIQLLKYENIAKLKNIYSADFKDKDQISEDDMGYAALANGLNLVCVDSNKEFMPNAKLTRAEAADMIVTMIGLQ